MKTPWAGNHAAIVSACEDLPSPGLLVFPDLVQGNVARMIAMAGSPDRLRPHLKTTKMPAVVRLLREAGIGKFKCATLAELEMALATGARDVLLAYQPVGPNLTGLARLAREHPEARLSTLVDCALAAERLAACCRTSQIRLGVFIDIDCGMGRTGIRAGRAALDLQRTVRKLDGLEFQGWHVYDGHIRQTDLAERRSAVDAAFRQFWDMAASTNGEATVIAGGTPSFPIHASDPRVVCSPGTCVFWDAGYAHIVPDMPFDCAALLLTRVVSVRGSQLTLDLGHKAVAAENSLGNRVLLPAILDARFVGHSEEHLVLETAEAEGWQIGDALLGIPWHICPTVALHDHATTIVDGQAAARWPIAARHRI